MEHAFFFVLGAVFGSFGNVLIFRLPQGKTIGGRSQCPSCGRGLSPIELIPIVSYFLLLGQCRGCRKHISLQYPLVELASGLLFVAAFRYEASLLVGAVLALAFWLLLLVAVMDARTGMIADAVSIPLLVSSGGYALMVDRLSLAAVALGAGVFGVQWLLSRGRWIGTADIFLGAGIGLLLGTWQQTLISLLLAYIVGAITASVLLLLRQKTVNDTIAFGPFLAGAAIVTFFWGEQAVALLLR